MLAANIAIGAAALNDYPPYLGITTAQQVYEDGAYVGSQMISVCGSSTACQSEYQTAMWLLFDPANSTLISDYNSDPTLQSIFATVAGIAPATLSTLASSVEVISPNYTGTVDPACPSGAPAPACGQPEFLAFGPTTPVVTTPESSAPVILGANLLGLAALVFVFRRRLVRVKG
jgi:hypothetical protein